MFLGHGNRHQPKPEEFLDQVVAEFALFVHLSHVRLDRLLGEGAHGIPEHLLLFGEHREGWRNLARDGDVVRHGR